MSAREETVNYPDRGWINAIDRPGAYQVGYLRKLMESRPVLNRIPDTSLVITGQGLKAEHIEAFRSGDNSYSMIYLPIGKTITVNTSAISGNEINAWWFNPKNATSQLIGKLVKKESMDFTSPTTGKENDWVLVIDDATKGYKTPGK